MQDETIKYICKMATGTVVILATVGLQIYAWSTGHDGTVFALTSLVIGGLCGVLFGIKLGTAATLKKINGE